MRLALFATIWMAAAAAQFVTPVPAVMPAWIVPYPGVAAENRQVLNFAESSYRVPVEPHDVLAHYRKLFADAGQPFRPDAMGYGFLIRAAAPECDLSITLQRMDPGTQVKITCSPRLESNARIEEQQARDQARMDKAASDSMKKFDSPVYPQSKPKTTLTWPSWLVRVDGVKLDIQRLPGQLRTSFVSAPTREAIQAYYAALLSSHGYRVTQGLAAVPAQFGLWIVATMPDTETGLNRVIRVNIKPAGQNFNVEMSLQ